MITLALLLLGVILLIAIAILFVVCAPVAILLLVGLVVDMLVIGHMFKRKRKGGE